MSERTVRRESPPLATEMATARIPLHRGEEVVAHALVDADIADGLSAHRWLLGFWGYAERTVRPSAGGHRNLAMHREVMGLGYGVPDVVHHINENNLDNRKENLRVFPDHGAHAMQPHRRRDWVVATGNAERRLPWPPWTRWVDEGVEVAV